MGMMIFEKSTTFNPADYGLKVGMVLQVVVVGGGGGGGDGVAAGGAAGEGGESGTCTWRHYATDSEGETYDSESSLDQTGGGGSGRGYGSGGGGGAGGLVVKNGNSIGATKYFYTKSSGTGGKAGKVKIATILLTSLDSIVITIGAGGAANTAGGATSFGSYVTADGGDAGIAYAQSDSYLRSPSTDKKSVTITGGGAGEGGYIIGLQLGGMLCDNSLETGCNDGGKGSGMTYTYGNTTCDAGNISSASPSSASVEAKRGGGGGGAGQPGESVGIGDGVCIVTW